MHKVCVVLQPPREVLTGIAPSAISDGSLPHGGAAMLSQRVSLTKLEIGALSSSPRAILSCVLGMLASLAHQPFRGCPRYTVRGGPPAPLIAQTSLSEAQTGCDLSTIAGLWVDSMSKLGRLEEVSFPDGLRLRLDQACLCLRLTHHHILWELLIYSLCPSWDLRPKPQLYAVGVLPRSPHPKPLTTRV